MAKTPLKQTERLNKRHIRRYWEVLESAAYRDLTCVGRCLLEELQMLYIPGRNGQISLSNAKAVTRLHVNKNTVTRAFNELVEHGFIDLTSGEYWQQGKAREWRLTFEMCGNRSPTDDWALWEPGKPINTLPKKRFNKNRSQS